jgi:hypothetical protein
MAVRSRAAAIAIALKKAGKFFGKKPSYPVPRYRPPMPRGGAVPMPSYPRAPGGSWAVPMPRVPGGGSRAVPLPSYPRRPEPPSYPRRTAPFAKSPSSKFKSPFAKSPKGLSDTTKRRLAVGGAVAGAGAAVAGANVASYKVNKQRAQQGKGPSYHFGGVAGVAGYRAGMPKRKTKQRSR